MSKIAVMGFGTVGSGTVELFYKHKDTLNAKLGTDLDIKYILEIRDFPDSPYKDKIVKDIETIISDPEITVAAEVMGGVNPAYDFVMKCLGRGISVVTSNKELVAKKGDILLKTARENGCNFFFEASTGGAIPIIRPLHECLAADEIVGVEGILNGTTNFILTKMLGEGMSFEKALALSQELGYAEKDPTADISGADSCRKICILGSLAFGRHIYPEWVYTEGIEKITRADAAYAKAYNSSIKLIAKAKRIEDGTIAVSVRPEFVCNTSQISSVSDVFNGISVYGEAAGELMFYGRGAGKLPTASAVVADIAEAAAANGTSPTLKWESSDNNDFLADIMDIPAAFYIRTADTDKITVSKQLGGFGVEFLERDGAPKNEIAFVVQNITEHTLDRRLHSLGVKEFSKIIING
ncbi:MAG: homoserine dehydrogenase [Ruminococcus sp.]|jgi:homoserine dehydrogenase|nr:homoserine dehydrogenase [Ruminococcus sp.]